MNSIVYVLLTFGCAALCLVAGFLMSAPVVVAAPLVLVAPGYSLLGPRLASQTRGLELTGLCLGTSIAVSILLGTGLSRLNIAITSESLSLSYGALFAIAAIVWAVSGHTKVDRCEGPPRRSMSRVQLIASATFIVLALVATALLFAAPRREAPAATQLGLLPHEPSPGLRYEPGETLQLEAQISLPSTGLSHPELVVSTSSGQSFAARLVPEPGVQRLSISILAPDVTVSVLEVTATVEDGGSAISPEVRLNMRPLD